MYTRDFNPEENSPQIPKNYSGTALLSEEASETEESEAVSKIVENKENAPSWFEKMRRFIPFSQNGAHLSFPTHLGSEELIIIALVAFLVLSKNFDLECIIMLVALLFI